MIKGTYDGLKLGKILRNERSELAQPEYAHRSYQYLLPLAGCVPLGCPVSIMFKGLRV